MSENTSLISELDLNYSDFALARVPTSISSGSMLFFFRYMAISFSLLNISVLLNKKLKESLYRFLLIMATVDTLYGIFVLSIVWTECPKENPNECSPYLYLVHLILFIGVSEYLTSCLALFNILLEIFLTTQRIFLISNLQIYRNASVKRVCFALLFISLIFYSPVLFMNQITSLYSKNEHSSRVVNFKRVRTEFGKTEYIKWTLIGLNSTRVALVTIVLLILNIVAIIKFNQYFERKFQLNRKKKLCY
jgi:hypothetical protein